MANPGLKKSKSFVSKKSPSVKIISSPNPNEGDEIVHFSHPQHPLAQVHLPFVFTCMGCKEYGAGTRFQCLTCNFNLHDFCAFSPPSIQSHPLHSQHQLIFYAKPSGFLRSKCETCSKATKGFAFRCITCNVEMHPCCTMLYPQMDFPAHPHTMILLPASAIPSGDSSFFCGECQRKRSGRVYYCAICNYYIHAVCAKDMVNGLYVHGLKAPKSPSMLEAATRIATHAVREFLDGLIEGIGESVGGAIIDNFDRDKGGETKSK
ncbi:protein VACUOLELESS GAMETOPHYTES [Magnolia sinica]|uniref:protein VACUOLELESS GAMETOPHYTES n=1 Tax=Magnolia sinica TaxID=86752 RepID=UPI002657EE18|nr:protein VACUOLELESS GAMETOPHYTES [Magnolia sinica]